MTKPASDSNQLMDWLRLMRISALPSAISNVLVGYLLTQGSWQPVLPLVLLLLASSSIYLAGMILNDVFDVAEDTKLRPRRPIPAGKISVFAASVAGYGLLIAGVTFAAIVSWLASQSSIGENPIRPVVIAGLLVVAVLAYDGWFKKSPIAPVLMGSCRFLNVLLGASFYSFAATDLEAPTTLLGLPVLAWWVASSLGLFIAGVTWLARKEGEANQVRMQLGLSAFVILVGLLGLAFVVACPESHLKTGNGLKSTYPWLIGLIAFPILRRVLSAVAVADGKSVQMAVIVSLKSIIILDGALCFLLAPGQIWYALAVAALLLPAFLLSRFIPPT